MTGTALAVLLGLAPLAASQDGGAAGGEEAPVARAEDRPAAAGAAEDDPVAPAGGKPAGGAKRPKPARDAADRPEDPGAAEAPPEAAPAESAEAFADLLYEAILLERDAQNVERGDLGGRDVERLSGILLKRRQRIDRDRAEFEQRLSGVSLKALTMPTAPPDAELSTKERVALDSLTTAYEATRDTGDLRQYMAANRDFLATADGGSRDRAVRLRDEIIERESEFLRLAQEGREILRGGKPADEVERMIVRLRRLAPGVLHRRTDVTGLVIQDEEVRAQVVEEALAFLQTPTVSEIPEQDARTLAWELPDMQIALVEASGLRELREELTVIDVELQDVEARLADRGVNSLSPEERKEKTNRWSELTNRQSLLQRQWMRTPPAQPELDELLQAQDELIRRSMYELGHRGALFAHRYHLQRKKLDDDLEDPYERWQLLEEQASLIAELDEARPDPGPLAGLPPRQDPRFVQEQAALILALKRTRPDLFRALPPPTKPRNIKLNAPKPGIIKAPKKPKRQSGGGGRRGGRRGGGRRRR